MTPAQLKRYDASREAYAAGFLDALDHAQGIPTSVRLAGSNATTTGFDFRVDAIAVCVDRGKYDQAAYVRGYWDGAAGEV